MAAAVEPVVRPPIQDVGTCVVCIEDDVRLVPFFCCFPTKPEFAPGGKPHQLCMCMKCMYNHGVASLQRNTCATCPLCKKSLLGEFLLYTGWKMNMVESVIVPYNGFTPNVRQWQGEKIPILDVPNIDRHSLSHGFAMLLMRVVLGGVQPAPIRNCPLSQDYTGDLASSSDVFHTISFNHTIEKYVLLTWNGPQHGRTFSYCPHSRSFAVRCLSYFSKTNVEARKQRRLSPKDGPVAKRTRTQATTTPILGFTGVTLAEEHHEDKMFRRALWLL